MGYQKVKRSLSHLLLKLWSLDQQRQHPESLLEASYFLSELFNQTVNGLPRRVMCTAQHSPDMSGGQDTRGIKEKAPWGISLYQDLEGGVPPILPWGTSLCQDLEGGVPSILPEKKKLKDFQTYDRETKNARIDFERTCCWGWKVGSVVKSTWY